MRRLIIISLLSCIFLGKIYTQNKDVNLNHWMISTNFGYNSPIGNSLKTGFITDPLIEYDNEYWYLQFVQLNYFFRPHLGISLSIQVNPFTNANQRIFDIEQSLEAVYGSENFITTLPITLLKKLNFNPNLFLGVSYRKQIGRIFFIPRFQIGTTTFSANNFNVYLKEKGTNNRYQITYKTNTGRVVKDNFTLLLGLNAGYHLTQRFSVILNLQASVFRPSFQYQQSFRDTFTEEQSVEFLSYERTIFNVAAGLGFGYEF